MRWFKHFSDNYRGRSIDTLFEEMGHTGVSCYYLLMEICTEKLSVNSNESLGNLETSLNFPVRFVMRNLRLTHAKLESFLSLGSTLGLFSYKISEKELKIEMPILLNLLDRDMKKPRLKRDLSALKPRPDKEEDKEEDKERDKELLPASEKAPKEVSKKKENFKDQNNLIKQSYFDAYRLRYGVDHVYSPNKGDAAFNGQVSKLRARIGTEQACNLVKFYVWHEDKFYKESNHSFSLCLRDAEKISNQMLSGVINKSGFQQKTKADTNLEYFKNMYGQINGDKNG